MDTLQSEEEEWKGEEGLKIQAFNSDADHNIHLKVNVLYYAHKQHLNSHYLHKQLLLEDG